MFTTHTIIIIKLLQIVSVIQDYLKLVRHFRTLPVTLIIMPAIKKNEYIKVT